MAKKSKSPKKKQEEIQVKFTLAEEVRAEISGKFSLLGVYPGEQVVVSGIRPHELPTGVEFALQSLAFIFVAIGDLEGKFDSKYQVVAPDRKTVLYDGESQIVELKVNAPSVFGTSIKPFVGPEFGLYTTVLTIGEFRTEFPFEIRRGEYKIEPSPTSRNTRR